MSEKKDKTRDIKDTYSKNNDNTRDIKETLKKENTQLCNMSDKSSKMTIVFKFSLIQSIKNKVFIILTLLCAALMMIIVPIMSYVSSNAVNESKNSIKSIEIIDENGYIDKVLNIGEKPKKIEAFLDVKTAVIKKDIDKYKDVFAKDEDKVSSLLVHITKNKKSYLIDIYKQDKTKVKDTDITLFSTIIEEVYKSCRIATLELGEKGNEIIAKPIITKTKIDGEKESNRSSEISVIFTFMFVVIFFISLCGENISTQIVTEKSTKLVEYLLTTMKPMDLVSGKLLAAVVISFIQLLVMICSGLLSIFICKKVGLIKSFGDTLTLLKLEDLDGNVHVLSLFLALFFVLIGFLFYAIIACCLASTATKLEEIGNVNMIYSVIVLISVYTVVGIIGFGTGNGMILDKISLLIPFTAVCIAPAYVILGKMDTIWTVLSIISQSICLIISAYIASKVYMSLIMYNGNKLSFKKVISIVRNSSKTDKVGDINE